MSVTFNTDGNVLATGGFGADESIKVYFHHSNEFNFGGTSTNCDLYFGYRAMGSKPVPTTYHFGNNNASVTAGCFYLSSSRKNKHGIEPYTDSALDLLDSVNIVKYVYNNDPKNKTMVGFIAEDTDELLAYKTHDGMDINTCVGVLIKAIQELCQKKEKLKKEVEELKSRK